MKLASIAAATLGTESLFHGYRPAPGIYDEMLAPDGSLRSGWHEFVNLLDALGARELGRRWDQARGIIHEDGVTYNVHGDPQGRDRRWELDALPLVVRSDEWSTLSAGLAQRARLLNAVLVDLYGPQHLVREGLLPGELVFAHPYFLRPCHGWKTARDRYLHLYAAHLARSPDGAWWVVADRTQAPAGAGYAVENRIVISRMIPHIFHHCRAERLAGFFMTLRESLAELTSGNRDARHTVLLSPGPSSPTYFEDSYLARYLGYTLVEGEDLTVRDNRVFLKTLGGLIGVDVALRRVRDEDCDPLEMPSQRRLGVSRLVHAARRGNVVLANALGSGLLEAPALMAFLPAVCRRLLGEELITRSVRTWWCGDSASLAFVLSNLENLVIRTANPDAGRKPLHGAALAKAQRDALAAEIKASPAKFVAQELVVRSTAPVWSEGTLRPGHIALRTFLVASDDSYQLMPGALAHVSTSRQALGESMFVGHGSKDVWVLADGPVAPLSLLQPPGTPLAPRRSGNDLTSRVADHLCWLGRHIERAESSVRLMRNILTRLIGESEPGSMGELAVLVRSLTGEWPPTDSEASDRPGAALELRLMSFLYDPARTGGLAHVLAELRRAAGVVRDRISLDTWRILQRIDDDFQPGYPLGVVSLADILATLNQMILDLSAFSGVATENMTRGPGWQFLDLGRRVERALTMIGLLRTCLFLPTESEHAVLEALLEIADSSMTYRNRYATSLQLAPLVDLLMTDETNPRSIAYQLAALADHVERLPRQASDPLLSNEQRLVRSILSAIRLADVNSLVEIDEQGTRQRLDRLLSHTAAELASLASSISHKYLIHAGPAHQLSEIH